MGIRSVVSRPLAAYVAQQTARWTRNAGSIQHKIFESLIAQGRKTQFGRDHAFDEIRDFDSFRKRVSIGDYETLKPYVQKIKDGQPDVLWPGQPLYLAKTSGTTSGIKYIPITHESIPNHINGARNALLNYIHHTGNSSFLDGRLIFLSGSPELDTSGPIPTGRLSGIVNHHVPSYLRSNQLPSFEVNCIDDWEEKLERIIDETLGARMTLISGIPPWVQMYFDRIEQRTQKKIAEVFPDFSLFVYGGVNFEPYRTKLFESIGRKVDSIELYPASEGFIAYQDIPGEQGMLLLLNAGLFYEFVPVDEFYNDNPRRLTIDEVETGKNYALLINNNAGLWGYSIGDTIRFVSKDPYRIIVTGRIKHFLSAFGEHVIGEEVEKAMQGAIQKFPETSLIEFTVAPQVTPGEGLPYHEWLVEFGRPPHDIAAFSQELDQQLRRLNIYYDDLISGSILRTLKLSALRKNAFIDYMKSQGKLGGQNKVPRLSNDRKIADVLLELSVDQEH